MIALGSWSLECDACREEDESPQDADGPQKRKDRDVLLCRSVRTEKDQEPDAGGDQQACHHGCGRDGAL